MVNLAAPSDRSYALRKEGAAGPACIGHTARWAVGVGMFKAYLKSLIRCAVIPTMMTAGCGGGLPSGNGPNDADSTAAGACAPLAAVTNLLPSFTGVGCCAFATPVSDGHYVYFSTASALYRVPTAGGSVETLYAGPFGRVFAAGGGTVAWVVGEDNHPTGITVKNASGLHHVTLASGAVPAFENILVDTTGNVIFQVNLPTSSRTHTWRWNPETNVAGEMPGIGMPDAGAVTNLYRADRGQVIWSNKIDDATGGIYATDIATGTAHQLTDNSTTAFESLVGVDATNVYGTSNLCPTGGCPLTVNGVPRNGGAPFVAYQSDNADLRNGLQADESSVYWIDWGYSAIYRAKRMDDAATAIAAVSSSAGISLPTEFALDACNVYWFDVDQMTAVQRLFAIAK
jgi:hypothetical protein